MSNSEEPSGYTVVVQESPVTPKKRRVKITCEECGSEDVTAVFTCYWDKDRQCWVGDDHYGMDDYCNNCDCECEITEYIL